MLSFWAIMNIMSFILMVFLLTPVATRNLDVQCSTIEFQNETMYCAPFSGGSFYLLDQHDSLLPVTFTDDQNYRIIEFHVTPFTAYVYNGRTIDKYYLASGERISVYGSKDISTFTVTPWEELIIADRKKRELIFLDFTYDIKYSVFDLNIKDFCLCEDELYILTGQAVVICDELGNERRTVPIPGPCDRITGIDGNPAVYLTNKNLIFILNAAWQKNTFAHTIQDIACSDSTVFILGDDGFTLYTYPVSNFR
jgi:hypothetical protein